MSTNATMSETRNLRREHKVVSQGEWVRYHDRYGTNKFADADKPYGPPTAASMAAAGSWLL